MILVDTSVWIQHLRKRDPRLALLLEDDSVLAHPWVIGELALGSLSERARFLGLLNLLPQLRPVTNEAVLQLIESEKLYGRGIGWVDSCLLASCLARPCRIWTRDARLRGIARSLGLSLD